VFIYRGFLITFGLRRNETMATYLEKKAKTLIKKNTLVDSWFLHRYQLNPYRGCEHACIYCDGMHEKYNVQSNFSQTIEVKSNTLDLFYTEYPKLDRTNMLLLGSGVGDIYQPAERLFEFARTILLHISEEPIPLHILTKSELVQRDLDILSAIAQQVPVILSVSFCSIYEEDTAFFEPHCASIQNRLALLKMAKEQGLSTGVMLLPIIPMITDSKEHLEAFFQTITNLGVDFCSVGTLTLKKGRQEQYFLQHFSKTYPDQAAIYHTIYPGNPYGNPVWERVAPIYTHAHRIQQHYRIPPRIPKPIFENQFSTNTTVAILLSHISALLQLKGIERNSYAQAAYHIMKLKESLPNLAQHNLLSRIPSVGSVTEKMIREYLTTGTISYYDSLMKEWSTPSNLV
jgi:DNA repair photolyase